MLPLRPRACLLVMIVRRSPTSVSSILKNGPTLSEKEPNLQREKVETRCENHSGDSCIAPVIECRTSNKPTFISVNMYKLKLDVSAMHI